MIRGYFSLTAIQDGITIMVTPENISLIEKDTYQTIVCKVDVYNGSTKVKYGGEGFTSSSMTVDIETMEYEYKAGNDAASYGCQFCHIIKIKPNAIVEQDLPFTITYQGTEYQKNLHINVASDLGIQPNLLSGTNFNRNADRWNIAKGKVSLGNGMFGCNEFVGESNASSHTDILRQSIYGKGKNLVEPNKWYTLSFYARGTKISTFVYGEDGGDGVLDTSSNIIVDGVKRSTSKGGHIEWKLSDTSKLCTMTFKTRKVLSLASVLFRLQANAQGSVSAIKLEYGNRSTKWCLSEDDKIGEKGAGPRFTKWKPNVVYLSGAEGEDFYDVVEFTKGEITQYYLCTKSHTSVEGENPNVIVGKNGAEWEVTKRWDLLLADKIAANRIDTDAIKATKGFFDNIEVSGTVKADKGYFRGFIFNGVTRINPENILTYLNHFNDGREDYYYFNFSMLSPIIYIEGDILSQFQKIGDIILKLPYISPRGKHTMEETESARGTVGKSVLIYNYSNTDFAVSSRMADGFNGQSMTSPALVRKNEMSIFHCELRIARESHTEKGGEDVYWWYETGIYNN